MQTPLPDSATQAYSAFSPDRQSEERVQTQITRFLKKRIQNGEIPIGARLPATSALARQWGVNLVAVHKALKTLAAEGFLDRRQRLGTTVRRADHTIRIGLLLAEELSEGPNVFLRARVDALCREIARRGWEHRIVAGLHAWSVEEHRKWPELGNVLSGCSGTVHVSFSPGTSASLRVALPLPCVRMSQIPTDADVMNDPYRFGKETGLAFAAKGCRRWCCMMAGQGQVEALGLSDAARERGQPVPQVCVLGHHPRQTEAIEREVLAFAAEWQRADAFPDAILVTDDIAMIGVARALSGLGEGVTGRLTLATLAHEGCFVDYDLNVLRYEYATSESACVALDLLWRQILGETVSQGPRFIGGRIISGAQAPAKEANTAL